MQSLAEYDVLKKRLLSLSPTLKTKPTSKSVKFRKISKKILWIQSVLGLLGGGGPRVLDKIVDFGGPK